MGTSQALMTDKRLPCFQGLAETPQPPQAMYFCIAQKVLNALWFKTAHSTVTLTNSEELCEVSYKLYLCLFNITVFAFLITV